MSNQKSIAFGGLLPHLIGCHHFFLGAVKHRLDPIDVIETLELAPEETPTFQSQETETPAKSALKKAYRWHLVGIYPIPGLNLQELTERAKASGVSLNTLTDGLLHIEIPRNLSAASIVKNHFFNITDRTICV